MAVTFEPLYLGSGTFKKIKDILDALDNALASIGTDKLRVTIVDVLPESPFNLTKIGGTILTGRDWSGDFAKLQNLDTTLSSRASETTLAGIKAQTDKLAFDTASNLKVNVAATVNPPNLDVALSTRASEATLSSIAGALASRATDKLRVTVVDVLPESPHNLTKVAGVALTGRDWSSDFAKLQNLDTTLSSRASEATLSAIAGSLASRATDKLRVTVVDVLPESPHNLTKVAGVALTGRDWSSDFAKLQNIDTTLSSVRDKFTTVTARTSVAAASNTAGVELSINNAHRSVVDAWVYVGGAATIEVYGSIDGVNWRKVESVTLPGAGEWMKGYITGFPYMKVRVPTTGIDVTIELAANPG